MASLETADPLTAEFPALSADLRTPNMLSSVNRQPDGFAAFTRHPFATGRPEVLRHRFAVATSLLRRADRYLTSAIHNV